MKIDITNLLVIFDELIPSTNEEVGFYWFMFTRHDSSAVKLSVNIYEDSSGVSIWKGSNCIVSVHFSLCTEVNVLDEKLKQLEIIQGEKKGRIFLDLLGNTILQYDDIVKERRD